MTIVFTHRSCIFRFKIDAVVICCCFFFLLSCRFNFYWLFTSHFVMYVYVKKENHKQSARSTRWKHNGICTVRAMRAIMALLRAYQFSKSNYWFCFWNKEPNAWFEHVCQLSDEIKLDNECFQIWFRIKYILVFALSLFCDHIFAKCDQLDLKSRQIGNKNIICDKEDIQLKSSCFTHKRMKRCFWGLK